jgi:hypothetical protein
MGTRNKPYSSISVNRSRYTESLESDDDTYIPNAFDLSRASNKPWAYLVKKRLKPGRVCVARHGKCLAIGAGHVRQNIHPIFTSGLRGRFIQHLTTFHLGLEAKVTIVSREDYDKLIANDCPGSNKNKTKAAKMRSFELHSDFIEPGSSSNANRTINIFAAIVSESFAIILSDFARLIRMHVTSIDRHWTQEDLDVGSPVSHECLTKFCCTPTSYHSRNGRLSGVHFLMVRTGSLKRTSLLLPWRSGGMLCAQEHQAIRSPLSMLSLKIAIVYLVDSEDILPTTSFTMLRFSPALLAPGFVPTMHASTTSLLVL